jgi:hypothetical protein
VAQSRGVPQTTMPQREMVSALFLSTAMSAPLWIHTPDISLLLSDFKSGAVFINTSFGFSTSALLLSSLGEPGAPFTVTSFTANYCPPPNDASVCVRRTANVTGQLPPGTCCALYEVALNDVFSPAPSGAPSSISWTLTVEDLAPTVPWRTSIRTDASWGFAAGAPLDALFWAPRGGAPLDASAPWVDTLAMLGAGAPNVSSTLGHGFVYEAALAAGRDVAPIAVAVAASIANSSGVALFHDPSDALHAALLDASPAGSSLTRLYNRLGQGAAGVGAGAGGARFTTWLVPLAGADWRPAFAWARSAFPAHFLPASLVGAAPPAPPAPAPPPHLAVGLGLYTCAEATDLNATFLARAGANMIWDAHFFWPYQGLFLPPNETWVSNTGDGEETACGSAWRHGDAASRARVRASYDAAPRAGLSALAYYNLFHFGENVKWPLPPAPSPPSATAWTDASLFLAQTPALAASVLQPVTFDWQNSIVLDPGNPARLQFLLDQVADKVASFGDSLAGLVIDELEPAHLINFNASAGLGAGWDSLWCGSPCRFLLWGWMRAAAAVQALLNPPGGGARPRALLANFVGAQRVDVLAAADGVFTENYYRNQGALANALALATTGKPVAVLWTNSAADMGGDADAFFARHAYLKLFPMAPALGSDHAIDPSAGMAVMAAYEDWGPIFRELRGACWHLAPRPVAVVGGGPAALANAFTVGGGCTAPGSWGGNGPVGALLLLLWERGGGGGGALGADFVAPPFLGKGGLACSAASPGGAWEALDAAFNSTTGRWAVGGLRLPRGAALVKCAPQ